MRHAQALRRLDRLLREAPVVRCGPEDRFVIFSDLHMGAGGSRDEFRHNAPLFQTVLRDYYLPRRFKLVLNGDVEDLYKFPLRPVQDRREDLYRLFDAFHRATAFYKIVGNHDLDLAARHPSLLRFPLYSALRLQLADQEILVLHGHQADVFGRPFHRLVTFLVRYVVSPLGIPNGSVAYDEAKKYRTEQRIYDFAKQHKIMAVIGHTHRPLFESLSRIDYLKFQIENLCRTYPAAAGEKAAVAEKIRRYQQDLQETLTKDRKNGSRSSLYDSGRLVPCVFNSGCATGKRGVTALEIAGGRIALIYWFDRAKTTKYFNFNGYQPEALGNTDYFRVPLKEDNLDYVFTRIKLLA